MMSEKILVPALGESITEASVILSPSAGTKIFSLIIIIQKLF